MTPKLTKDDVRAWLGQKEIDKGRPYAQRGALLRLRVQGGVIKGDCLGSSPRPYRVEVRLNETGIQRANCSCPVGDGGRCKHTAALLLNWIGFPELFTEVEALKTSLNDYSKDDLIALVGKMVERYPDLETLVETSAPNLTDTSVSAEAVKAQVQGFLGNLSYEREHYDYGGYPSYAQNDLQDITHMAERYLEAGQLNSAATTYKTIADEVLRDYHDFEDEEGSLSSVAQVCAEGLIKCLERAEHEDENLREIILTSLFELYCEDLGGYGIGDGIPEAIVTHATQGERQEVARWTEKAMPKGDGWGNRYEREALGRFLLELQHDTLNDETFLRISRETGRVEDAIERLLELGRLDDAVKEVENVEDYRVLGLVDLLTEAGHADTAYRLVLERSKASDSDNRFLEWLKAWHERRGEFAEAFECSATLFWRRPYIESYREMRRLGEHTVKWQAYRETLLTKLNLKENYALLTEIYLLHGAVDAALGSLAQLGRIGRSSSRLSLAVARAAERSRPEEAINLYRAEVNRLIEARGRRSYAEAARHLLRVQDLYERLGRIEVWESDLRGLLEQHKRLRALKEELGKVGLEARP